MTKSSDFDRRTFVRATATEHGRAMAEGMEAHLLSCGFTRPSASPIETILGCALAVEIDGRARGGEGEESCMTRSSGERFESLTFPPIQGIYGFHEVHVGNYRVDFLIVIRDLDQGTGFFAVECDGHDFHERTKRQAEHDKRRDRYLQTRGLHVFRLTGSEIWRDPAAAATAVIEDCYAALESRAKGLGK